MCSVLLRRGADAATVFEANFFRSAGAATPVGIEREATTALLGEVDPLRPKAGGVCVSVSGKTNVSCVNGTLVERLPKAVIFIPFFSAIERISKAIYVRIAKRVTPLVTG